MELEDRHGPDGLGAADLSGDSGAVGRLLVSSAADDGQPLGLMVDLKGSLYNVTVAPLQGTVCVVSVGQAEAKVGTGCGSPITNLVANYCFVSPSLHLPPQPPALFFLITDCPGVERWRVWCIRFCSSARSLI
jgi:hypothetical protein